MPGTSGTLTIWFAGEDDALVFDRVFERDSDILLKRISKRRHVKIVEAASETKQRVVTVLSSERVRDVTQATWAAADA